ncbi:MAG: GNAT family N-acetyltransferase [Pontixanthobacter sp.]
MFHRSERLFLRPAWPEDWEDIYRGIADEGVACNLASAPWPYEPEHACQYAAREQDPSLPSFLVTLPGAGVIGSAGIGIDGDTGKVQLGYWIARSHWGLGFATEAARSVLLIAKAIGHKHLIASHFVDNPASGKVLRKAGFRPTGQVRPGYSLARGRRDPVACFEAVLDSEGDVGPQDMRQAA